MLASWAHKTMIAMRDYLNEDGKAIVAGRNIHQWPTGGTGLSTTGPYDWAPDKLPGFFYPENNGGDDDLPGTAFQRYRDISNDTWQNYLGVVGRGTGSGYGASTYNGLAISPTTGSIFSGMAAFTPDASSGNDPNEDANGISAPRAKSPTRLRNWSGISPQEPLRQERIELDVSTPQSQQGGFALSTADTVVFGFGLEQVPAATRNELVARSLAHLLPTAADTTAPSPVAFKWPAADAFAATPRDPVEVDVTAADERGDLKEVRLLADGVLVDTKYTFPFQFRYYPQAADVGETVTLTAQAEDGAGNVGTATRTIVVSAAGAVVESPLPVAPGPAISGEPAAGRTLACSTGSWLNGPDDYDHEWLRNGEPIAGATAATYTTTAADLGKQIRCRVTASNDAGDGDATSDFVIVSGGPQGPQGPPGSTVLVSCTLSSTGQSIVCEMSTVQSTRARIRASVRLAGSSRTAVKQGRNGTVRLRLGSSHRIARSSRVVVKVKIAGRTARMTVRLGHRTRLALKR